MSDKKRLLGALAIALCSSLIFGAGLSIASGPETIANPKRILKPVSPMEGEDVYPIPKGSVIKHLPDNLTEAYGPDGKLLLTVRDDEVELIPTSTGLAPATFVHQVPSNSFVDGVSERIAKIYDPDGNLILTIMNLRDGLPITSMRGHWIEATEDDYVKTIWLFDASWTCPIEPIPEYGDTDDVDHLFIAVESNLQGYENRIVQPVLSWNYPEFEGYFRSQGAAWAVWESDYVYSTPVNVNQGDSIYGKLQYITPGYPYTTGWLISFKNQTTGETTALVSNILPPANARIYTALEGYNLEETNDVYDDCHFTNMHFKDHDGNAVDIQWNGWIDPKDAAYIDGLNVIIYNDSHVELETGRA